MPSRINIGPEDGPFVAINESSGNLQLEDNSGNVVAEWDETNARWDFANNTVNNVDALNSNSVSTESLVIGGSLYEEDDNSPFIASDTDSATYNIAGDYQEIIVLPDFESFFDQIRTNGKTHEEYEYIDNGDQSTSSATQWDLNRFVFEIQWFQISQSATFDRHHLSVQWGTAETGVTVSGTHEVGDSSLDSFTLLDSGGTDRDISARVFGRDMDL